MGVVVVANQVAELHFFQCLKVCIEFVAAVGIANPSVVAVEGIHLLEVVDEHRVFLLFRIEFDPPQRFDGGRDLFALDIRSLALFLRRFTGGTHTFDVLDQFSPDRDAGTLRTTRWRLFDRFSEIIIFPGPTPVEGITPCGLDQTCTPTEVIGLLATRSGARERQIMLPAEAWQFILEPDDGFARESQRFERRRGIGEAYHASTG